MLKTLTSTRGSALLSGLLAAFALAVPHAAFASAYADVTFTCLDFSDNRGFQDFPFADIDSSVDLPVAGGTIELDAAAEGEVPTRGGVARPTHGAAGGVSTGGVAVLPFDFCRAGGGSEITVIVEGASNDDPGNSGSADVYLAIEVDVTLEFRNDGDVGDFTAFAGLDVATPLGLDTLDIAAGDSVMDVPPELTIEDLSSGGVTRYRVAGITSIGTELRYGPGARNLLRSTFFAGGEFGLGNAGGTVAGFATASALDTLRYRIISRDPDVSFSFVSVPEPGGAAMALAALGALAALASVRRSRGV